MNTIEELRELTSEHWAKSEAKIEKENEKIIKQFISELDNKYVSWINEAKECARRGHSLYIFSGFYGGPSQEKLHWKLVKEIFSIVEKKFNENGIELDFMRVGTRNYSHIVGGADNAHRNLVFKFSWQ